MFVLRWRVYPIEDFKDLIPDHWFDHEGEERDLEHVFLDPSGRRYIAECSVEVEGSIAVLSYGGRYAKANIERDACLPGDLKLVFLNEDRRSIKQVLWRHENEEEFEETGVIPTLLQDIEGVEEGLQLGESAILLWR
jgi:hypothetical protein